MKKIQTNWDLKRYFYSSLTDPKLKKDWNSLTNLTNKFIKKYEGKIKLFKAKDFIQYFKDQEKLRITLTQIAFYLNYSQSLNTQDPQVLKKLAEFQFLSTELSNKVLFINEEFKLLGAKKLMQYAKQLPEYENYLYQEAISLRYLLDEKTEFALNLKSQAGSNAFVKLYNELTGSFVFNVAGKKMTDSEVRALRNNYSKKVRKQGLEAFQKVYNDDKIQITLSNAYKSVVRNNTSGVSLRKYNSVMSPRNLSEQLSDDVVDLLINEVKKSYPLYHRYLKLKAKVMKVKKIDYADIYAPLSKTEKKFTFKESLDIYLTMIKNFDLEFYQYSLDLFNGGRVDVYPQKNKRGGAYCSYSKGFPSFVLLNFTGKLNDASTIAHEFGHAMHGHLSQKQKAEVYDAPLPLAETASVFNELMLSHNLLNKLNKKEKVAFLAEKIEQVLATIHRQIQYVSFEKRVHETLFSGKDLSRQDLNMIWREETIHLMGKNVKFNVPAEKDATWTSIPHIFHAPFYCYSYAFGNLLSFALYSNYEKEGVKFVPKYKELLAAGNSLPPEKLLKKYGFDVNKKEFYQNGLDILKKMIDEFEMLVK